MAKFTCPGAESILSSGLSLRSNYLKALEGFAYSFSVVSQHIHQCLQETRAVVDNRCIRSALPLLRGFERRSVY